MKNGPHSAKRAPRTSKKQNNQKKGKMELFHEMGTPHVKKNKKGKKKLNGPHFMKQA